MSCGTCTLHPPPHRAPARAAASSCAVSLPPQRPPRRCPPPWATCRLRQHQGGGIQRRRRAAGAGRGGTQREALPLHKACAPSSSASSTMNPSSSNSSCRATPEERRPQGQRCWQPQRLLAGSGGGDGLPCRRGRSTGCCGHVIAAGMPLSCFSSCRLRNRPHLILPFVRTVGVGAAAALFCIATAAFRCLFLVWGQTVVLLLLGLCLALILLVFRLLPRLIVQEIAGARHCYKDRQRAPRQFSCLMPRAAQRWQRAGGGRPNSDLGIYRSEE